MSSPKRKRKLCSVDGCPKQVVQGGLCISHGAKKPKRKKCTHPGCTKVVRGKAGLCRSHWAKRNGAKPIGRPATYAEIIERFSQHIDKCAREGRVIRVIVERSNRDYRGGEGLHIKGMSFGAFPSDEGEEALARFSECHHVIDSMMEESKSSDEIKMALTNMGKEWGIVRRAQQQSVVGNELEKVRITFKGVGFDIGWWRPHLAEEKRERARALIEKHKVSKQDDAVNGLDIVEFVDLLRSEGLWTLPYEYPPTREFNRFLQRHRKRHDRIDEVQEARALAEAKTAAASSESSEAIFPDPDEDSEISAIVEAVHDVKEDDRKPAAKRTADEAFAGDDNEFVGEIVEV